LLLSSEIREDVAKIDLQCFSIPILLEWNCSTYYLPPVSDIVNPAPRTQMAPHVIVRSAIASDVATFPHMKVRTWYDTYKASGVPDWDLNALPQEKEFAEGFEARIRDPMRITGMWVVHLGLGRVSHSLAYRAFDSQADKVIGYATATRSPNANGYIDVRAIYIMKEYQGLKIGQRLMELVAPSGCRAVVETLAVNTPAIRFYESLGFVRSVKLALALAGKILNNK
jgi:ribosomal protein S18 acetylase RimI-like enzyme